MVKPAKWIMILLAAMSLPLFGSYTEFTWCGGGADNNWRTKANWDGGVVPTSWEYVRIPSGDWTINLTGGSMTMVTLTLLEGTGTVTLTGDNATLFIALYAGEPSKERPPSNVTIPAGRTLVLDGASLTNVTGFVQGGDVYLRNGNIAFQKSALPRIIDGNAKLHVINGSFLMDASGDNNYLYVSNNAEVVVFESGKFRAKREWWRDNSRLVIAGGEFSVGDEYFTVHNYANVDFRSGKIVWMSPGHEAAYMDNPQFAKLAPPFGCELILPSSLTADAGALRFAASASAEYDAGGVIYATNNTDVAAGNVYFAAGDTTVRGGATIYANAIKVNSSGANTHNLELSRLNLGIGGFRRVGSSGNQQYVNFRDGIVFGAWGGDVPASPEPTGYTSPRILMHGPVEYDTRDCFDPETSRTISMNHVYIDNATDFKAVGGGTVALSLDSYGKEELRTLEVADNTTLAFSSSDKKACIKAMNLKLGANATLNISLKNGDCVDASCTAEFGAGSKIVVTDIPDALEAGMFYPVYFAPVGSEPDLSKIEYAEGDWPTGWFLAKTGSAVYLTDGNPPVYSTARSGNPVYWSGAGSDNVYTNLDNWVDNAIVKTMGADIRFCGRKNTEIVLDGYLQQRSWYFYEDSGPFMFSGEWVAFQYPVSFNSTFVPTIYNEGKFPVVIENNLQMYGFALWALARKQSSSISLMGSGCTTNYSSRIMPMLVGGDIRIGGSYTSEYVRVAQNGTAYASARTTRLTIMPGGSLKVLVQSGDFNERGAGAFAVAAGGTLDIAGTELLLTSNNTHYVDGTMTVACPLVPQGRQAFRGDGTLTLSGGVSGEGVVRVEGELTLVPGGAWGSDVTLSVKDDVTIAPTADWDFGGAGLDLAHHSALAFATGGHKVTLRRAASSVSSTMTVAGGGQLVLAEEGTRLNRLSLEDSSTVAVGGGLTADSRWVTALVVRDDSVPIEFSGEMGSVKQRKYEDDTGYTVYCIKGEKGMMLIIR